VGSNGKNDKTIRREGVSQDKSVDVKMKKEKEDANLVGCFADESSQCH